MPPRTPGLAALLDAARMGRDAELAGKERPLLALSWVRRRQRQAAIPTLLVIGGWVASIFVVIIAVRPLMLRNDWYGLLAILWLPLSFVPLGVAWAWVYRRFSLVCPYCGSVITKPREPGLDLERLVRCGHCAAKIIDPDS